MDYYNQNSDFSTLLVGRKIVAVGDKEDTLTLDDGRMLEVVPNEGCGGCTSGGYWVSELNTCDNVITGAEVRMEDAGGFVADTVYSLFVFAENKKINALAVEGTDGNGYYGTGFRVTVRDPE